MSGERVKKEEEGGGKEAGDRLSAVGGEKRESKEVNASGRGATI